jgi:light-regulated signal transduction histidine kinase (bacteriophytochrome)
VAATFLPIRNEKDEFVKILAIAHDISTVKSQQQYIEKQNEKLKEQRKEIIRINNSLEERVKERTEQLEKQNQQLLEYAFINAHLLRAPVCNILGLIDLLKNHDFDTEQMEIIQFLDNSTKELDEMVMKINRSIKKGYYDDPQLTEQVKNWSRKQNLQKKAG